MAKSRQLPIFPLQWKPRKGGLRADVDPKEVANGDLYCTQPETGGLNIRMVGKGLNVSPSYEPMTGDKQAYTLSAVAVQVKQFRLNVDITEWSSGSLTTSFDVQTPSGITLGSVSNTEAGVVAIGTLLTNIKTQIDLLASLSPTSTTTTIDANTGYIDFYFDAPLYLDFTIANLNSTNSGVGLNLDITQEAIDAGMVGEWNLIGSDDRTGDAWEAWTTRRGLPEEITIQNVVNNSGNYEVTTSAAHGLVDNQSVKINSVQGNTDINGVWTVTVLTPTSFVLIGSTFGGVYTASTGILVSNIVGYGQIGVAVRDDNSETVSYTRLLQSREFNWSTLKQVDMRVKKKQNESTACYFVDDKFNVPRVFYYKGDFVTDGALTSVNSENIYEYGNIASELTLQIGTSGATMRVIGQLDSGGGLYSGNWRYTGRFLTEALNGSDYLLATNPIPVYSRSYSTQGAYVYGDEENIITSKVNQVEIVNPDTERFRYFELIAINYIGTTPRAYYVGRFDLTDSQNTIIVHTGQETTAEDFDVGLVNQQLGGFYTASNIELQDNRAVLSNLLPANRLDFSAFVATFRYSIEREAIQAVGTYAQGSPSGSSTLPLNDGEYLDPMNAYGKKSFMFHETYRVGFMFKYKQTGTWSEVFHYKDIVIDLPGGLPANGRDVGTFTTFDMTDSGKANIYTAYLDFHGFDLDMQIDGTPFRDVVSEIQPVFVKVNPSIYGGVGILGVTGILTDSNARASYNNVAGAIHTGPYPWACGTALGGNGTPIYQPGTFNTIVANDDEAYPGLFPTAVFGGAVRESAFILIPDLLWEQETINPAINDQVISVGRGARTIPYHESYKPDPSWGWPPNYAEFEGFTNVSTNAGRDIMDVTNGVYAQRGTQSIGFPTLPTLHSLMFIWDHDYTSAGNTGDIYNRHAVESCLIAVMPGPGVPSNGVGPDYGVYNMWYRRNLTDQYGPIENSVYENWGEPYIIGDDTGVVPTGTLISYGDVFTQKTYSVFQYPAADGWGQAAGIGYYSQNRMNSQMKRKATPTSPEIVPVQNAANWIGSGRGYILAYPQNPDPSLNYNRGYTPQNNIRQFSAFDSDALYQKDWSNAIAWSDIEVTGSNLDALRYFPPLNIKFLDYTDGAITNALSLNNEYVTFQARRVLRQYFNTSNMLSTGQGAEVVIGDGSVMGRKGQTMSQFGCVNKWSVIVGKSEKGHDVVYYFDAINKNLCRVGYDGTNDIGQLNGLKSFFANYSKYIIRKDTPAHDEGICGVANQRYREVIFTFRGRKSGVNVWDNSVAYTPGQVVQFTPTVFTTFEQTGEFYTCLQNNVNSDPENNPLDWEVIPHTNGDYYNEYTIIWNEVKNEFQAFWSAKPKIYARINDSVLIPRPISNTGIVFEMNDGDGVTEWFNDGVTSLQGQSFFDAIINQPEGRKGFVALRVESDFTPDRVEAYTNQHYTFMDSGDFEQREGNEFDVPILNDATGTANNKGNTSKLFGDWVILRFIMNATNYNLWSSFILKVKQRARTLGK